MPHVQLGMFVWLMVIVGIEAEWRFATRANGELCVMMDGQALMPEWCVISLDIHLLVYYYIKNNTCLLMLCCTGQVPLYSQEASIVKEVDPSF